MIKLIGSISLILLMIIIPIYLTLTTDKNRLQSLGLSLIGMGAMITYGSIFHKMFVPVAVISTIYAVVITNISNDDRDDNEAKIILNYNVTTFLFVFSAYLCDSIKYILTIMGSH